MVCLRGTYITRQTEKAQVKQLGEEGNLVVLMTKKCYGVLGITILGILDMVPLLMKSEMCR